MVGQTISHYKITDKLGAGGMGVVYKALDLKLERTVALKFLPTDVAVSDRDKQSLLREARAASALDHPNIGVIHGIEESEEHQPFIVMGYYERETLAQKFVARRNPGQHIARPSNTDRERAELGSCTQHRASRRQAFEHHCHQRQAGQDC